MFLNTFSISGFSRSESDCKLTTQEVENVASVGKPELEIKTFAKTVKGGVGVGASVCNADAVSVGSVAVPANAALTRIASGSKADSSKTSTNKNEPPLHREDPPGLPLQQPVSVERLERGRTGGGSG